MFVRPLFLFLIPSLVVGAHSQSRDGLAVQQARQELVKSHGNKAYTHSWNFEDLPHYKPGPRVSGTIRVWGSNYIGDSHLAQYWEEGFHKLQPGIHFEHSLKTALTGIPGLYTNLADIAVSRPLVFDELLAFERVFNYDPLEITAATGSFDKPGWAGATVIFVNKENPLSKLTIKQLDDIFGAERAGAYQGITCHPEAARSAKDNSRTWGQLGLSGRWKDQPIHVYGSHLRYYISRLFERLVFQGGDKWKENLREYANYAKPDGTLAITGEQILADLSKDPYGIGYAAVNYLAPQTKTLALVKSSEGKYVSLSMENLRNRTYPLSHETYVYINRRPGQSIDPKVLEFLKYVPSQEGQRDVVHDEKYLLLTQEAVQEQLQKLR